MEKCICVCFGHRNIWKDVDELRNILEDLIINENVTIFMTGGMGEFDSIFSSNVRSLKKQYKNIKLWLVKPYFSAELNSNKNYYESQYDEIIIPDVVAGIYPKAAITKRNRWMVEQSDIIISYINKEYGGAYMAVKYAKSLGKRIISVTK